MNPETEILETVIDALDEAGLLDSEFSDRNQRWLSIKPRLLDRIREQLEVRE